MSMVYLDYAKRAIFLEHGRGRLKRAEREKDDVRKGDRVI